MSNLKTVRRPTLEDLSQLLVALSRFPYFGAIMSLFSALYDLYDFIISLFKKKIIQRKAVASAALSRFLGHSLIGLGGLVPIVTVAAFMILNPCIIPLVALLPAISDLYKYCKIVNTAKKIVAANYIQFKNNPTKENLAKLKESREMLYRAKQEQAISTGLVIGTALSAAGLIFPPLLMAGVAISLASAVFGFLDKRYRFSERISQFIFGNPEIGEEDMIDNTASIIPLHPINVKKALPANNDDRLEQHKQSVTDAQDKEVEIAQQIIRNRAFTSNNNQNQIRFFQSKPTLLTTAPALMAMNHYKI